jgi:nicotinamide-nucleotide amidase
VRAAILAVGSELLSVDRLDTNSLRLTGLLERHGVELVRKAVVGDDEARIALEVRRALDDAELVLVGGGLGPTVDDVTREACALALDRELVEDPTILEEIERRFAALGRAPAPNNRRQALVLAGARVLANRRGTAPGQRLDLGDRTLFLLPGVPPELDDLLRREVEPWLAVRSGRRGSERRTLWVAMRPESEVDQRLAPLFAEFGREPVTLLASPGEVRVRLTAAGDPEARRSRLAAMAARVRELLGDAIYGEGEGCSLEVVVGEELLRQGLRVATAESCTGGLLAERLTRVPGASGYFPGGVVVYADEQKVELLGVESAALAAHGAVSEQIARAMAEGARRRFAVEFGLAITGIAGPGGGTTEKPVGTVQLAIARRGEDTIHRALRLPGDRERIRWQASQAALELLRRRLLGLGAGETV